MKEVQESSCRSFQNYFHAAISNHVIAMSPEWMVALNSFNCSKENAARPFFEYLDVGRFPNIL